MQFLDISADTQNTYRLKENERVVFFMKNRNGNIAFDLAGKGAEAHIFALYDLAGETRLATTITEIHSAPGTKAKFTGRALIRDSASLDWHGLIHITKSGAQTDAHQELRSLLLSPASKVSAIPSLEIENDDVKCGHSATASAPNPEQLFFLRSRGLSEQEATDLITAGFVADLYGKMEMRTKKSSSRRSPSRNDSPPYETF